MRYSLWCIFGSRLPFFSVVDLGARSVAVNDHGLAHRLAPCTHWGLVGFIDSPAQLVLLLRIVDVPDPWFFWILPTDLFEVSHALHAVDMIWAFSIDALLRDDHCCNRLIRNMVSSGSGGGSGGRPPFLDVVCLSRFSQTADRSLVKS